MKLQVSFKYKHTQMIEYFGLLFGPVYMYLREFVSIIFSENVSNIIVLRKKTPVFCFTHIPFSFNIKLKVNMWSSAN